MSMLARFIYCILLVLLYQHAATQESEREANLKAVFIYNFTKYVDWDTSATDNSFVIGVIGTSAVTQSLIQIAKNNNVKNKPIMVKTYTSLSEIGKCQVLFISKSCPFTLQDLLENVKKGVLVVSEQDGYAKLGAAFNFIIIDDKLKFEANLGAIDAAGLKASSQLLKLAKIVEQ